MLIDMHLHSAEYSPDSDLRITDAIVRAKQLGLDGLCVTDHGAEQAMRKDAKRLSEKHQFLILVGAEITSLEGDLLLYNCPNLPKNIKHPPCAEVIALATALGGIVVPAHPFRWCGLGIGTLVESVPGISGIETFNGKASLSENSRALSVAKKRNLASIGGSDAHDLSSMGTCATHFAIPIRNESDLAEAILKRACNAVIWNGKEYEDAERHVL